MAFPEDWYIDTATVEMYLGRGVKGDSYGPATPIACYISDDRKTIRSSDGTETVSETTLHTTPDQAALFTVGSKVTSGDRSAFVISVRNRHHPVNPQLNHLEVMLT